MTKVYTSSDSGRAHVVKDLLMKNDIAAVVQGEPADNPKGTIPLPEAWPSVWILHQTDTDHAKTLIADFDRALTTVKRWHNIWKCERCEEINDAGRTECWKCAELVKERQRKVLASLTPFTTKKLKEMKFLLLISAVFALSSVASFLWSNALPESDMQDALQVFGFIAATATVVLMGWSAALVLKSEA
jgi:hypothetical protein